MFGRRVSVSRELRVGFLLIGIVAAAACSGHSTYTPITPTGGSPSPSPSGSAKASPSPSPTPTASPSPTMVPVPQAITTSVPLAINASGPAIAAAPLPAPTGYTSRLTVPIASAPAGTTFQFISSLTLPSTLPILQSSRRAVESVRIPQSSSSNLLPIFFDAIVPSQAVTVAGAVSVSQVFPAGVLSTTTSYYLAFYDSTQPTPEWQTIEGPITTTDGVTLTFSGSIKSFTFQANQLYGFAIFALANTSATPPPSPQTIAYLGQGTYGITEYTEGGSLVNTLPITAASFGLDDSGNIYALIQPSPAPSASATPPSYVAKYAPGSAVPEATYAPNNSAVFLAGTSGAGELGAVGYAPSPVPGGGYNSLSINMWNPGAYGPPSYTLLESITGYNGFIAHDGTLYVQNITTGGLSQISVYPPGSSTPSRTIQEQQVPAAQQVLFSANYAAIGPDGTLYLTEYTFQQPDPLAGLYIYHPDGTESFVRTTGATGGTPGSITGDPGPEGVDVDGNGNIYVSNSNLNVSAPSYMPAADTLNDVEVFAPGGTSVLRHITVTSPVTTAVASDGTAFVSTITFLTGGPTGTYVIPAGSSTATEISGNTAGTIVLYDGNRETTGIRRAAQSVSFGAMSSLGGSAQQRIEALLARRRH